MVRILIILCLLTNLCKAQADSSIVFNQNGKNWLDSLHGETWVQYIIDSTKNDFVPICVTDSAIDSILFINGREIDTTAMLYIMPKANVYNPSFQEILGYIQSQPQYSYFSMKLVTYIYKKPKFIH